MLALLIVSLVFVAGGVAMARDEPVMGSVCAVFFGICAAVAVVGTLPGSSYLELRDDGFVTCSLYRKHFIRWEQIQQFVIYRIQHSEKVGWRYSPAAGVSTFGRRLSSTLAGVEGGLPDTYGLKPRELLDLMNAVLQDRRAQAM
jgi:hypothetical protein